jgi:hypothetical protein
VGVDSSNRTKSRPRLVKEPLPSISGSIVYILQLEFMKRQQRG